MVVITGIKTAIKIAPIIYKGSKIVYQGFKKTKYGAQWMSRHPNIAKYGTAAAGVGGLLLDLSNIDYSALPSWPKSPYKNGQTRGNVYGTKPRRWYRKKRPYCYRRPKRR